MRTIARVLCALAFLFTHATTAAPAPEPFDFKDGDRVVFLGDTWVEREQSEGYIEARITTRLKGKKVFFRNLAWSADTVLGESRASFDPPEKGFDRLKEQLQAIKPTVAFLGYGMAESFDGEPGLPQFKADMLKLIDTIEQISSEEGVRFVICTPLYHENPGAPLPDPARHNEQLKLYSEALREIATQRKARLIPLFDLSGEAGKSQSLTFNGIHPTPHGYWKIAGLIEQSLGLAPAQSDENHFAPGRALPHHEQLRESIVKKNELFFHRWRPQNQTYLFGFRRHEQGQNAKEIPMFDPLISAEEERIFSLAKAGSSAAVQPRSTPAPRKAFDTTPLPHPAFELAPDLEVSLFAENPDLAKPIHMNFDPQGRLWVASSEVYPQIQPGQQATDKILILEDTDQDGVVDKSTVFAEGLLIPTGVEPGDGGAYVANSTELLFFKDTDGDGKADHKQILLSGFGTEDTHHILHSLRWGHDGQLYMNQSIYIHSRVETPHGVVRLDSGGIWNYRPATHELGIHMKGLINSWGHHFDRFGQSFATDGAGHEGINWVIPQAMYVTYEGARRILGSVSPGSYPKFCGLEIIESEHFPADWQGSMVTCDFRAHRVVRFGINDQGAGYITKELPDVMRTSDVTFRPIDVKAGPDGALYIADWSNPIIQHGEVDFRDPRRDHEHGRIWRISYKGRDLLKKPNLVNAASRELLDNLRSPNGHLRQQSRRVLTERGSKIHPELENWAAAQRDEQGKLEALWMYQSVDVVAPDLLRELLTATSGETRAAAVRVLSFWHPRLSNPIDLLAPRVRDEHPRVRVEAVRALAKVGSARSAELILGVLDLPMDKFLDYAVWLSINDLAEPWVRAIQNGEWQTEGRENQLAFGLKAIEPHFASQVLAKLLAEKPLPRDGSGPWFELISTAGSPAELQLLYNYALSSEPSPDARAKALHALHEAARVRKAQPERGLAKIESLFATQNQEINAAALRLVGKWALQQFTPKLLALAGDKATADHVRDAAFQSLRELGGAESEAGLLELAGPGHPFDIRREAVRALAASDLKKAAPLAIEVLSGAESEDQALALWRALLSQRGAAPALTQVLPRAGLPEPMVRAGLRAAREGGRNEPNLVLALARNIDAESEAANLSPEELQRLLDEIRQKGDPSRGELVYRREELGCVTCHAIGGVGGKVGPDITSIGASAQLDYLVESMLFPNRKVKEGYHSLLVLTKDEMEYSGILVRETDDQLILRDASNREVSVPKADVEQRTIGGSIMPAGLIDALSEQEQLDLYRFLSELGRNPQFDASKGNVARSWRLMPRTLDLAQFDDEKIVAQPNNDWHPVMTLVDGRLPKHELEASLKRIQWRNPDAIFAATRLEVPKSGPVRLQLPELKNARLFIDGEPVEPRGEVTLNLRAGSHVVALRLDARALPEDLRLTTSDGTFVNVN